jgi:hypothetical protein
MPSIKLTDRLGADFDVDLPEDSSIARYISGLTQLRLRPIDLSGLKDQRLDQVPVSSVSAGASFDRPLGVGIGGAEMEIGAGLSGRLALHTPDDGELFEADYYGDPVGIAGDERYLSVGLTASIGAGAAGGAGDLSFGFDAGTSVSLTTYTPFTRRAPAGGGEPAFPTFGEALRQALEGFSIPGDLEDLRRMAPGTVSTAEGRGALKFSAGVNLLSVVNPLAAADLPVPAGEVKISSGAAIKVGAAFEVSGEYQIRVQKLNDGRNVRLGFYRKRGSAFGLKVSAGAGLSATVGRSDLIEALLRAASADPRADGEELAAGGLSAARVAEIEAAVKAGVQRKLELALSYELNQEHSREAAFLFEADLDRLDAPGRLALHKALDADLSALTGDAGELPAGIRLVRSIFTEIRKARHALKLNLVGIYNYISVSTLILKGTVQYEPESGELVIADKATASRIRASAVNFAADGEKLRRVLAESVLITAAYRCSGLAAGAPQLHILHSYFELHTRTGRQTLKDSLDVAEALGLIRRGEKEGVLGGSDEFGRTMLYAETRYGDALATALFLDGARPRSREEYERAGRRALLLLVQEDDPDSYRRLPAVDDGLWGRMKSSGQPGFRLLDPLRGLSGPQLGAVTADFSVIVWWAEAMEGMAARLAEIRRYLADNPGVDAENNTFKSLRRKLAERLKNVAKDTKEQFSDPWGLVAMDLASGQRAPAKVQVTGAHLSFTRERGDGPT